MQKKDVYILYSDDHGHQAHHAGKSLFYSIHNVIVTVDQTAPMCPNSVLGMPEVSY